MAEEYFSLSPYHYAGNNPIKNIDINGEWFSGNYTTWFNKISNYYQGKYDAKKKQIQRRQIREIKALSKGKVKKAFRINKRISNNQNQLVNIKDEFNMINSEIGEMANSSQEYHINEVDGLKTSDGEMGYTTFNFTRGNGAVEINIDPDASFHIFMHEMKHGYQFEKGRIDLTENGGGLAFDKYDEYEAYARGGLYHSQSYGMGNLPEHQRSLPNGITNVLDNPVKMLIMYSNLSSKLALKRIAYRKNNKTYIYDPIKDNIHLNILNSFKLQN